MANRVKVKIGRWSKKEIFVPETDGIMEHIKGCSIMLFGISKVNEINYRPFFGIGMVRRIAKGEEVDLVYINFGGDQIRQIVCVDNRCRRQILTLKRGQFCSVFGYAKVYSFMGKDKNGNPKERFRWCFFGRALQGWYVPTMVDIRKMPTNEDITPLTDKEENFIDYLDQFETKGEEDD